MTDNSAVHSPNSALHAWQKLPWIAIVYFSFHLLRQIFGQLIYLIPALLIGYSRLMENLPLTAAAGGVLLLVVVFISWLKFHFYRYRFSDDHLQIRSGVISKTHLDLPFHRIHNVKLEQPLFYRPGNHTCVLLDTAGSSKDEAKIFALPMQQALSLKSAILQQATTPTVEISADNHQPGNPSDTDEEVELNRRSIGDLIIHGVTSNRIWIFLGGLAPFFDNLFDWFADTLSTSGFDIQALLDPSHQPLWRVTLTLLTLVVTFVLLLTLFSVLGAIISFYGYRLSRLHDRYICRSGLFTRHEVSMKRSRLQMIVRRQDWLDRLIGRINLKLEQFNGNIEQGQATVMNNKIIVPSITHGECEALLKDIYADNQLNHIHYQAIDRRFLLRNMMYVGVLHSAVAILVSPQITAMLLTLLSLLVSCSLIYLRWKRWGFALDDHYVYIRKGLFGVDYYSFALSKIQQSKFRQSLWMKPYHLCSVTLVLACGGQSIPYINSHHGRQLINQGLFEVEAAKASWM
ncbi:PH domain-containing protein [Lacimicrobium sp. SS2-24]|uniref:PH domain-containing protein n=1 Tax=Lacimicrobium sp. SS2-24 TaxID=2005569 RepID=UPI000B4BC655|nr:PH domain-containing protein [Lacimicrobium sp. SS2-24]